MTYVFASLDGAKMVECEDLDWHSALESARDREWDPEGTALDFQYQLDQAWDDTVDYTVNLMLMIQVHMSVLGWNGSYTEKENQIISESDAYSLYRSLDETFAGADLLKLLAGGAVRICK